MKRSVPIVWLMMFVVVSMQGCVIVIGNDEADGVYSESDYAERQARRDDRAQATVDAVRRTFDADDVVRNEAILIAARGGEVTLSGEASSGAALDRALRLASAVENVDAVVSRVVVEVKN